MIRNIFQRGMIWETMSIKMNLRKQAINVYEREKVAQLESERKQRIVTDLEHKKLIWGHIKTNLKGVMTFDEFVDKVRIVAYSRKKKRQTFRVVFPNAADIEIEFQYGLRRFIREYRVASFWVDQQTWIGFWQYSHYDKTSTFMGALGLAYKNLDNAYETANLYKLDSVPRII